MRRLTQGAALLVAASTVALCAQRAASPHGGQVRALVVALAAAAVVPALLALWRVSREVLLELRLRAESAPGEVAGVSVRWLDAQAPFVAGIVRPTIYWPRRFNYALLPGERRAVVLHEEHHRCHGAPRRLLLLGLVGTLAPAHSLRRYVDLLRAELEIEADAGALAAGATRASLASALLRLAPASAIHGAGFTTAVDVRVRSLLGDRAAPPRASQVWIWFGQAVAIASAAACFVLAG